MSIHIYIIGSTSCPVAVDRTEGQNIPVLSMVRNALASQDLSFLGYCVIPSTILCFALHICLAPIDLPEFVSLEVLTVAGLQVTLDTENSLAVVCRPSWCIMNIIIYTNHSGEEK